MRHRKLKRKLGRTSAHRETLLRSLTTSLLLYEKIITTVAKAKELRKIAERMITLAKRKDLHARRQAAEVIQDERVLKKLFETIGERYQDRNYDRGQGQGAAEDRRADDHAGQAQGSPRPSAGG